MMKDLKLHTRKKTGNYDPKTAVLGMAENRVMPHAHTGILGSPRIRFLMQNPVPD